jgi:O-antigen/teichoic acid export membrane protein
MDNHVILTGSKLLSKNALLNFLGQASPLVVMIFAFPVLVKGLGTDRFGLLGLAWIFIGYFSLFDLGIGRALVKILAEKIGKGETNDIPKFIWTSLFVLLILGIFGALILTVASSHLIFSLLSVPRELQTEALLSFYIMALAVPAATLIPGLRGILEAFQRFGTINVFTVSSGVFTFLVPVLLLQFSNKLPLVIAILVIGRWALCLLYLRSCLYLMPEMRKRIIIHNMSLKALLSFGLWVTVSNIISPLMLYLDRFLISGLISISAVAYYVAPYDVVTKLLIIPWAAVGVLFPAFVMSFEQNGQRAIFLFSRALKYTFLIFFPIIFMVVGLSEEGLKIWLGDDFSKNSTYVVQWLTLGVFINGFAQFPFAWIQGRGRPDITARLHIIELPIYVLGTWWLINKFGIEGAAIAWFVRVTVDAIILFIIAHSLSPKPLLDFRRLGIVSGISAVALIVAMIQKELIVNAIFLSFGLLSFFAIYWLLILDQDEKNWAYKYLRYNRKSIKHGRLM